MGIKYLWDTNTVIYFLQKQYPTSAEQFVDSTLEHSSPAISAITEIELLCWKTDNEKDLEVLHNFIEEVTVFELEEAIKLKTADIRKVHKIKIAGRYHCCYCDDLRPYPYYPKHQRF